MRAFRNVFLALALLALVAGCDSGGDERSDAEIFVGVWSPVSVSDGAGDQTQRFGELVDAFVADLKADGTFNVTVDYNDVANAAGRSDIALGGTYAVNEGTKLFTLTVSGLGGLPLNYNIENDNRISLSGNSVLVNLAFGTTYTGNVTLVIERQ